jgi:hypothetical protein
MYIDIFIYIYIYTYIGRTDLKAVNVKLASSKSEGAEKDKFIYV